MHSSVALFSLLALSLSGCLVGPNYRRSQANCEQAWEHLEQEGILFNTTGVLVDWWRTFEDPLLDELMDEAVRGNLELREAAARIWEARERRRLECTNTAPAFTPGITASRIRQSNDVFFGSFATAFNEQLAFNEIQVGFDVSWEIDLWGRNKRLVEAADARYWSTIYDRRAITLSLMGEVARTFAEIRGFQKRLELAWQNVETQADVVEITQARYDGGIINGLDVTQAQTLLSQTESSIPILESMLDASIHRMGVLLGRCPSDLWELLHVEEAIPPKPPEIPVGLPSDLVRRRPDLQRLERELAARSADIGVAIADYFPRFSLTQALGLAARDPNNVFQGRSLAWQIGGQLIGPLIQGKRLSINVRLQHAQERQAFYAYQQAILEAFEEVRNALVAYYYEQARCRNLEIALENSRASFEISTELYTNGLQNFLDVLDAQRSMLLLSDELASSQAQIIVNAVNLFKALGGGWELGELCE